MMFGFYPSIRAILLIPVFAVSVLSLTQSAQGSALADFSGFSATDLKLIPQDKCKTQRHGRILDILGWTPTGASDRPEPAGCEPFRLEEILLRTHQSTYRQANELKDFFAQCGPALRGVNPLTIGSVLSLAETKYEICDHPAMRKVIIKLPTGELIRGVLALKPGHARRPLVITKCGVLCNTGDSAMRFLLMHLFDESPFNVLALASDSGSDFVKDNGYLAPGGLREGHQIIHVAKMMRASPFGARISSIHFVGVSLGGQGGLYASILNDHLRADGQSPLLASTLATCPVVDLQPSIEGLFGDPVKKLFWKKMFQSAAAGAISNMPKLNKLLAHWKDLSSSEFPRAIAEGAARFYRARKPGWLLPPFENISISTHDDFWRANRFTEFARRPVRTPTLIFAADDDDLIETEQNALALSRIVEEVRKTPDGRNTGLAALTVASGNHCAFNLVYGWRTASSLYRSFVLSRSPELSSRKRVKFVSLRAPLDSTLYRGESVARAMVVFKPGAAAFTLKTQAFAAHSEECAGIDPAVAPKNCLREDKVEVQFASLAKHASWARVPRTEAEAESLTRWANVNLRFLNSRGREIAGLTDPIAGFAWTDYEGE